MLPRNERRCRGRAAAAGRRAAAPSAAGAPWFRTRGRNGLVERGADAAENATADQVEAALCDVDRRRGSPADQGRHAAARQHAVVDLQHEHRAGQVQQVAHAAEDADADEGVAAGAQRFAEFGTPDAGSGCH